MVSGTGMCPYNPELEINHDLDVYLNSRNLLFTSFLLVHGVLEGSLKGNLISNCQSGVCARGSVYYLTVDVALHEEIGSPDRRNGLTGFSL